MFPIKLCSISTTNPNLVLRLFITLFNLQGARRLAHLDYLTTYQNLCQELFFKFFELFSSSLIQSFYSVVSQAFASLGCRSRKRLDEVYHSAFSLSRTFFRFFNLFSSSFAKLTVNDALSQALGYLTKFVLFCLPAKMHKYPPSSPRCFYPV